MGHGHCAKIWPQLRLTKAWSRRAEARGSCRALSVLELTSLVSAKLRETIRTTIGPAIILACIGLVVYDYVANSPRAQAVQSDLRQELESITPLPGAALRERSGSYKSRMAYVGRTYNTTASYTQIRSYYETELARRGWTFHRAHGTRDWFRDFGGVKAEYCKGSYTASLQYAGDRADYGWVFSLEVSWATT